MSGCHVPGNLPLQDFGLTNEVSLCPHGKRKDMECHFCQVNEDTPNTQNLINIKIYEQIKELEKKYQKINYFQENFLTSLKIDLDSHEKLLSFISRLDKFERLFNLETKIVVDERDRSIAKIKELEERLQKLEKITAFFEHDFVKRLEKLESIRDSESKNKEITKSNLVCFQCRIPLNELESKALRNTEGKKPFSCLKCYITEFGG